MGWKDRDWYRDESAPAKIGALSAVTWVIVVTLLAYFVQLFGLHWLKWDPVQEGLALVPSDVLDRFRVWQLVTSMFLHDPYDAWHVAVNMLFLAMIGPATERRIGPGRFLVFYLLAGIVGGLAYSAVGMFTEPRMPAIGASGAVMGVVVYFTFLYPWEIILFLFIFPMKAMYATLIYVGWDLYGLVREPTFGSGVAHTAHLGGALFGFLYYRFGDRWVGRAGGSRSQQAKRAAEKVDMDMLELQFQVDALLQKVKEQGLAALTEQERAFLKDASEKLGRTLI